MAKNSTLEEKQQQALLFEEYMIEIWQWKIVNGQTTVVGDYISSDRLQESFKKWLKSRKS